MKIDNKYKVAHEKTNQATKLLKEAGIDSWLILTREGTDPSVPMMIGTNAVHPAAIFINSNGNHMILTSESDRGNFAETGLFDDVVVYEASLDDKFKEEFEKLNPQKLALNISKTDHLSDGLTLGMYKWLKDIVGEQKLEKIEVKSEKILKKLRSVKSETELERIKKAVQHTNDIYDEVFEKVECGMTEKEIGQLFVQGMKKRGVTNSLGNPYDPPLVCIVRAGLAHRKPGDTVVKPGDMVVMDFSVKYKDYCSDIARTIYFLKKDEKEAPKEVKDAVSTTINAVSKTIEALEPGKKGYEIDKVGRKHIENAGYPTIRHSTGHQVGRKCHDGGTVLGPKRDTPRPEVEGELEVGEIYAIEPTVIQDDGLPSSIVEENVVIREDGAELLSRRQTELITISC